MLEIGAIVEGKITGLTAFGAFVSLPDGKSGMVHISEVSNTFVKDIKEFLKEGQEVKVKVVSISEEGKISLSIKQALSTSDETEPKTREPKSDKKKSRRERSDSAFSGKPAEFTWGSQSTEPMSFDDMLNKFKQSSDEKMHDIKRNMESKRGASRRNSNNY